MPTKHKPLSLVRSAHLENLEEIIRKIIDAATAPKKRKITRADQNLIAKYQLLSYLHKHHNTDPDLEKHIKVYGWNLAVRAEYPDAKTHAVTIALIYPHANIVPEVKEAYFDQKARVPKESIHRDGIGYRNEYHYLIYTDSDTIKESIPTEIGTNPLGPHPDKKQKSSLSLVRKKD